MVQVNVKQGLLEGEVVDNVLGGRFFSFKGIPYAEPPVGHLRFKAPQPPKPWDGVRAAKEHGSKCYQFDFFTRSPPSGSEDCLYLNVYTPDLKPSKPLPVMFWVHGGGFVSGCGNDDKYGPDFLANQGVILVTINYRMEILGFLSLDTEDIPGNAGMKDQVAALRWVKENIASFGGDPENITIFGDSAGGSSVALHLVSPMTKGLFKRVIAQSAFATCWWTHSIEPRERALALARELGCKSEDDKELSKFFESVPVQSLIQVKIPITLAEVAKECNELMFGVVSEKKFGDNERYFYGDPYDALRNGIHKGVEVMTGYCEDEGLLNLAGGDIQKILNQTNSFRELLVPKRISLNCPLHSQMEIGRMMKKYYFKNEPVSMENLGQLVKFLGMNMFVYEIMEGLKICANMNRNNTYLYKFTCKSERNFLGHFMGLGKIMNKQVVAHSDDIGYIFHMKIMNQKIDENSETFKMIDNVVKLWTNFTKYGNPTPDSSLGVTWKPYSLQQQNYLDIGQKLVPGIAPDDEEFQFWEDIFKEYLPKYVAES